jgi:DNA-binding transcriptional MerR regulator
MITQKYKFYSIGELARRSGVPVKTIRHYSDTGVLPPSAITEARYRLYSEADRARLELIRALRGAGFDLPTIARLLQSDLSPEEAVRLQLEAVEAQLRQLRRHRAVLRAALRDGPTLSHLDRAAALARIDGQERALFLRHHLERAMEGIPVDPEWKEWLFGAAIPDLPDDPTDAQLSAWLELAELVADPDFLAKTREQARPWWEAAQGHFDFAEWQRRLDEVMTAAAALAEEGVAPDAECARPVIDQWIAMHAAAAGRTPDAGFAREMLDRFEAGADPTAARYWELIALLRGETEPSPVTRAHHWLLEGVRRYPSRIRPSEGSVHEPEEG